jgi:branched-chain amino acid aminotransferase
LIYRGYDSLGVEPAALPVDVAIMLWEVAAYFTKEAIEEGLDVKISTWARNAPEHDAGDGEERRELRQRAAHQDGGDCRRVRRGDRARHQSEPERRQRPELFIVRDGIIYTPPIGNSVLAGSRATR